MSHDHHMEMMTTNGYEGHDNISSMDYNTPSSLTTPSYVDHGDHGQHTATNAAVMDHGQHNMQGGSHMMSTFFHTGCDETILFEFWKIDSIGGLLGSMIGIFLMAMLYEGLKVLREYLLQRTLKHGPSHHHSFDNSTGLRVPLADGHNGGDTPEGSTATDTVRTFLRPHPFSVSHTLQTFLHMVQIFISYLLMLIFMTYNVWLALAVILGAGAGYFVSGWRKQTIVDINEHCH